MKAVAIVSGGMDSVTLAYHLLDTQLDLHLLSVDYGQRHQKELTYATQCAKKLGVTHEIANLCAINRLLCGSVLTSGGDVPEGHYAKPTMRQTVVPNRNMILLSVAVGYAVSIGASSVYTGVHAGDHPVYPDCRPEFISAASCASERATDGFGNITIEAPFALMSKADIARLGKELDVPFEETWSCYKGGDIHCGRCSTCVERIEALEEAGADDRTSYSDYSFWRTVV